MHYEAEGGVDLSIILPQTLWLWYVPTPAPNSLVMQFYTLHMLHGPGCFQSHDPPAHLLNSGIGVSTLSSTLWFCPAVQVLYARL